MCSTDSTSSSLAPDRLHTFAFSADRWPEETSPQLCAEDRDRRRSTSVHPTPVVLFAALLFSLRTRAPLTSLYYSISSFSVAPRKFRLRWIRS